jgi:hypothetical protein
VVEETSSLFLIVFMGLMYCGGIPVMLPLAAVNILSRYIVNKFLILNYSSRVAGLTDDFNALSINLIPFSIIISCLFGIWMFTASSYIYPNKISVVVPGTQSWVNSFELFPRLFTISYTLIMTLVVLVYMLLYNTIVRFFSWLGSFCYEAK